MNNYINYQNLKHISLESLDINDTRFLMSSACDLKGLTDSIKMIGVITPIIIQKKENNMFRIVNGFKRFWIAKSLKLSSLTAVILEDQISFLEIFNAILSENLSIREFNIIEKALVVKSLKERGLDQNTIIKDYLSKLSLKYNPELFSWLEKILKLPEVIQEQLARDALSYNVIDFIDNFALKEQIQLISLLDHFKLGKNKQKEFINLAQDILRIESKSFPVFLDDVCNLDFYNGQITHSQKTQKLFQFLRLKRYPLYSQHEDSFNKWKNSLKLSFLKLEHSSFFESNVLKGSFDLKDKNMLELIINDLEKIKAIADNQWVNNKS